MLTGNNRTLEHSDHVWVVGKGQGLKRFFGGASQHGSSSSQVDPNQQMIGEIEKNFMKNIEAKRECKNGLIRLWQRCPSLPTLHYEIIKSNLIYRYVTQFIRCTTSGCMTNFGQNATKFNLPKPPLDQRVVAHHIMWRSFQTRFFERDRHEEI